MYRRSKQLRTGLNYVLRMAEGCLLLLFQARGPTSDWLGYMAKRFDDEKRTFWPGHVAVHVFRGFACRRRLTGRADGWKWELGIDNRYKGLAILPYLVEITMPP